MVQPKTSFHIDGQVLTFDDLIQKYAFFINRYAGKILRNGELPPYVDVQDLFQEGCLGLLDAARKYKPETGIKFATFASTRVYGAMVDHLRVLEWGPRTINARRKELRNAEHELVVKFGRTPTIQELAAHLGRTERYVSETYDHMKKRIPKSLDETFHDATTNEEICAADIVPDADAWVGHALEIEELKNLVHSIVCSKELTTKERRGFLLRYYDNLDYKVIAVTLQCSESRVSQICTVALEKVGLRLLQLIDPKDYEIPPQTIAAFLEKAAQRRPRRMETPAPQMVAV